MLRAAARWNRDSADAWGDYGRLLLSAGQPREALVELAAAARLSPASAALQIDLGRADEALGLLDAAEAAFRRAAELTPNLPRAHEALGRLLLAREKRTEGEAHLAVHRDLSEVGRKKEIAGAAPGGQAALGWPDLRENRPTEALARFSGLGDNAAALI